MRNLTSVVLAVFMVACTVGEPSEVQPPQDDNTRFVDTDGDGDVDIEFNAPCVDPFVDSDADGIWDGLDLDCDGDIDIPFDTTGGGGGNTGGGANVSQCSVTIINNTEKKQVKCTNGDCECRLDDVLTSTCTDTGSSCSFPGNCCGF